MRTLPFLLFLIFFFQTAVGQPRPWMPPKSIAIKVVGTGRTTGHIIMLSATNNTRRAQTLEIPALVIPSTDTHQGYVVPEPSKITIPPGRTIEHPIIGYCTNPDLPAPDAGTILPPLDTWDTDSPIIKTTQEIKRHTTQLQIDGQLTTPLSNNQDRERESVIQQTLWWSSVPAYDPCKQIFLSMDVRDTDWFDYKDVIDRGVSQMIDAIVRVGGAAGIKDYLPPPLDIPLRSAQPPVSSEKLPSLSAKGTGRTTGHIADIICHNPTDKPINIQIGDGGSLLIPSNGRYQSYVVPSIPTIPLGPRDKITIPVAGYCADIHRPPVPGGTDMPPLSDWIESPGIRPIRPAPETTGPGELVQIPVSQALPLDEATRILVTEHVPPVVQGWDCPDIPQATDIMIPGTDRRLRAPVDLDRNPAVAAPVILETANRIIESLETLYSNDMIRTPFSNNRQQERESIIQQTVWIYTASMKGEPYTKEDMRNKALEQLESATRQKYDNMPEQTRSTFDMGVEDIWGAINLVGTEAKVLPKVEPVEQKLPEDLFDPKKAPYMVDNSPDDPFNPGNDVMLNPKRSPKRENKEKLCDCGEVKLDITVWDVDPPKKGQKWRGIKGTGTGAVISTGDKKEAMIKKDLKNKKHQMVGISYDMGKLCNCLELTKDEIKLIEGFAKLNANDIQAEIDKLEKDIKEEEDKKAKTTSINVKKNADTKIARLQPALNKKKDELNEYNKKKQEIEALKKSSLSGDCELLNDIGGKLSKPKVLINKKDAHQDDDNDSYTATLETQKDKLEIEIEVSYFCKGIDCKEILCKETVKVIVEK